MTVTIKEIIYKGKKEILKEQHVEEKYMTNA